MVRVELLKQCWEIMLVRRDRLVTQFDEAAFDCVHVWSRGQSGLAHGLLHELMERRFGINDGLVSWLERGRGGSGHRDQASLNAKRSTRLP